MVMFYIFLVVASPILEDHHCQNRKKLNHIFKRRESNLIKIRNHTKLIKHLILESLIFENEQKISGIFENLLKK